MASERIVTPADQSLRLLCDELAMDAAAIDTSGRWPSEGLRRCGELGVHEWFVPIDRGGQGWTDEDVMRGYRQLGSACLTTTFILTQRTGACRRIAASENQWLIESVLPDLVKGTTFATVGISHLTTSRRHLTKPAMTATPTEFGWILEGFSPWVTGGDHARHIVLGAVQPDGRQLLVALPTDLEGVRVDPPARLLALSGSHTGEIHCVRARLERRYLIAGPEDNIMAGGTGARTGGLETSTLAVGLASAAIEYLVNESSMRAELAAAAQSLQGEHDRLWKELLEAASGRGTTAPSELRARANSLALRSSQAALSAAKGAGYVDGHPAGRWCREALFFLVWSCPAPVSAANLCELAGLSSSAGAEMNTAVQGGK